MSRLACPRIVRWTRSSAIGDDFCIVSVDYCGMAVLVVDHDLLVHGPTRGVHMPKRLPRGPTDTPAVCDESLSFCSLSARQPRWSCLVASCFPRPQSCSCSAVWPCCSLRVGAGVVDPAGLAHTAPVGLHSTRESTQPRQRFLRASLWAILCGSPGCKARRPHAYWIGDDRGSRAAEPQPRWSGVPPSCLPGGTPSSTCPNWLTAAVRAWRTAGKDPVRTRHQQNLSKLQVADRTQPAVRRSASRANDPYTCQYFMEATADGGNYAAVRPPTPNRARPTARSWCGV